MDDSADVRALIRTRLSLSGVIEVLGEGGSGAEAIALAAEHRPDLMLLDVSMPGIDGLAALPRVLERSPTTRVVMFSGFAERGLAAETRALGASAFLEKSVPFEYLLETLTSLAGPSGADGDRPGGPTPRASSSGPLDPVLEDHLERFREVFEDAAIGMATMTLAGRLVRANRSLAALFNTAVQDFVGLALGDLTGDDAGVDAALERLTEGEAVVQVEHRGTGSDDRHFRSTLTPVLDALGRPLYVFLQMQDVTRQVIAEAELRRTEARFRMLVDSVQDYAIFMLDTDGHIASWNAGAQRSKGYTADEIVGRHFRVFYPPELQQAGHPEHELELAVREGKYEEEGWRIRKDGSRFWATVTITAVRDDDGELIGFAKVTRDNTERRELLEDRETAAIQLRQLNAQLAQAAEEQAQFFAVTAHELRSPIAVLTGTGQTLAQHHDQLTPVERDELADGMTRSSEQLRRLVADLLTAARLQARSLDLTQERLDVGDLLHTVVAALRRSLGDAELRLTCEPGLVVNGDPGRLTQVVDNLVLNAVRHGRPPVEVTATGSAEWVEICVRDAGSGVEEDLRGRLFDRFATGSSRGTGLGLFLVRELARAHGGEAAYRSADGAFVVTLARDEE